MIEFLFLEVTVRLQEEKKSPIQQTIINPSLTEEFAYFKNLYLQFAS